MRVQEKIAKQPRSGLVAAAIGEQLKVRFAHWLERLLRVDRLAVGDIAKAMVGFGVDGVADGVYGPVAKNHVKAVGVGMPKDQ